MRTPKTVLVTGAQGALGRAVAERFLKAGCHVIGTDLKIKNRDLVGGSERNLTWVECNLADPQAVAKLGLDPSGKPIEGWIHCAGGFRWSETADLTQADLDFLIDANLRPSFHVAHAIVPGMKKAGFGRIVLVSARATLAPGVGMGAYAASKAGINALTSALAEEVKSFDVNVNAVLPTILDTPANRAAMPTADPSHWVKLSEIAEIIFELTQPVMKPIHGALIPVAGRV